MSRFTEQDAAYMRRALALARRGLGHVEPNPMVGAVVVRDGRVVGEGYHARFGGPHAEVMALKKAGAKARGATLYVTLEPCSHFGKTPPCAPAVAEAGIARVVAAMSDPFPRVRGRGFAFLRRAGVRVESGLLEADARELAATFITRVVHGRPYVIVKWAQSIDGRIATANGESKWISGEDSREQVQVLRGRMDAIIVGIGTALADDPLLMARPPRGRDLKRIATRIVLDSQCRLPLDSQLVRTLSFAPVMVVHAARLNAAAERRRRLLASRGVMTLAVPTKGGHVNVGALMKHLGSMDYANVLVEGGGDVLGSLFGAGLVDEARGFVAPLIIGGKGARQAVAGADPASLALAHRMRIAATERFGDDVCITLKRPL